MMDEILRSIREGKFVKRDYKQKKKFDRPLYTLEGSVKGNIVRGR